MPKLPPYLKLLRPKQWAKGSLVVAAALFTHTLFRPATLLEVILAFVSIGFVSSSIYILNDSLDVERDRQHPTKKKRPIASGEVTLGAARVIGTVCVLAGFAIAAYLGAAALAIMAIYLVIQLLYNFWLKQIPVADVFTLCSGYVLRAALGAAAINATISGWLLFCTGALALLVGIGKRRSEYVLLDQSVNATREALTGYTLQGLDMLLAIAASTAVMSYGIYSIQSKTARENPSLIFTSVWVFYAIYRYVYLIVVKQEGGEPETLLLRDRHIQVSVILFIVTVLLSLNGYTPSILERNS